MRSAPPTREPDQVRRRFFDKFGEKRNPARAFYAPGRVNLIGDHTDATGGLVFPCGVDRGTLLFIRRNGEQQFRFASTNFDLMAHLSVDELDTKYGDNWINYPLGVVDQFRRRGLELDGIDCLFSGDLPNGAGLSSSASLEVVTAFAINSLYDFGLPMKELVLMAQAAENDFVGMQCGVMDQFACALAVADHAILLDCATLEHRQVPLRLEQHAIVIANTNQRRELSESAYNDRVRECARAFELLADVLPIDRLGAVTPEQLDGARGRFDDDPVALARAEHVVSENARVREAVPALESGDVKRFGELMNASHDSLRDQFEVSSEPLDHLVSIARAWPGVLGSRLTGAGFGGCTVSLVPKNAVDAYTDDAGRAYEKATGLSADFYVTLPGNGVHELDE